MQLSLTVTFATGRYHGRATESTLEWPPSPLRLFQALIAGSHRGAYGIVNQDARDSALSWLEKLDPPLIETGEAKETGRQINNYVPNNDNQLDHVRTEKSMLTKALIGDSRVVYRWHTGDSEEAGSNAAVICAMAPLVPHLGQHQDTVHIRGEVTHIDSPLERTHSERFVFHPTKRADGNCESPAEGALGAYRARYRGVLNEDSKDNYLIPSHLVDYQRADVIRFDAPLALFEMWKSEDRRLKFEPHDLRQPAAMARYAMMEWLSANPVFRNHFGDELTSRLIGGHEPGQPEKPHDGPHIAFVPIPSLNEKSTADGLIRRVLMIGHGCETGLARELFVDAVGNLNGWPLKDQGRLMGALQRVEHAAKDPVLQFFVGRQKLSRVWRSVTPIVLTGMIRRGRPVAQLILRALRQAGISESDVDSVATFRGPIVPKTLRPLDYRVKGYLAETPRFHAEVIFRQPLIGPFLVGRGRHAGLGLMVPWSEQPCEPI